ncbi:MAG: TolC family protein [Flavipsychrobacter sp.]
MRRLLNSFLLTALLLPATTKAQNENGAIELSLDDAMKLAVQNSVQSKNARLDILKQRAINNEVTGIAYPNISAKGEFNDYINPIQSFVPAEFIGGPSGTFVAVPFTPKFSSTASVSGSQLLFDGSVMVALQARKALLKLYEQASKLTNEEVRYNMHIAYNSLVVANKQYEILKETIGYARKMIDDNKELYKAGFIEKIELDRTTVNLNNLASDSLKLHNALVVNEQMLKYLMGLPNEQQIALTDTSLNDQFTDAASLLLGEVDYMDRTDFNLLITELELNKYDLKRHRLSALPQLAAFGTAAYTYSTNSFNNVFNQQYIFYSLVGLQLNVPIFDGWQRRSRVKQAKISVQQTQNKIDYLKLGIDFEKNSSKTTLKNALLTMNNQKRNLDLANNVLRLAKAKYDAGVGSNTEVSLAQTNQLAAQNNYFQSLLEVVNAQAKLKKALGEF